ncbi:MAG: hypothetical protein LBV61_07405 [Burkholderiaceae bacterium]|jgi:hypothetical protein|nr:hypothetical protein [Burkholderiaceae bacterium]
MAGKVIAFYGSRVPAKGGGSLRIDVTAGDDPGICLNAAPERGDASGCAGLAGDGAGDSYQPLAVRKTKRDEAVFLDDALDRQWKNGVGPVHTISDCGNSVNRP